MAYVDNYKYDVFVSFALIENETPEGSNEPGWVTRFTQDLRLALRQRLGSRQLEIFYSPWAAQNGAYDLSLFEKEVHASAIMVSMIGPSYVEERAGGAVPFTMLELRKFLEVRGSDRLFAAQILPFYNGDARSDVLQSKIAVPFWTRNNTGTPVKLSPLEASKLESYRDRMADLAAGIADALRQLRSVAPVQAPPPNPNAVVSHGGPVNGGPTGAVPAANALVAANPRPTAVPSSAVQRSVLLALTPPSMESDRNQLRRHLEAAGIRVLPKMDYYPIKPADMEAAFAGNLPAFDSAFKEDLAAADLFVQLLNDDSGSESKTPVVVQAKLAAQSGKPILQWRHPRTNVGAVADHELRALLDGPSIVVDGQESFKTTVVDILNGDDDEENETPQPKDSMVFINHDRDDFEIAQLLRQQVEKRGLGSVLPLPADQAMTTDEAMEDLRDNYITCDALVFVYSLASQGWMRAQQRLYKTLKSSRKRPPQLIVIYSDPPPGRPPPDLLLSEVTAISRDRWADELSKL